MRPAAQTRRGPEAGLTLIELLVAMIILGVVTVMLVTGWVNLQRASAFALQDNSARAEARDAINRTSVELRDAQPTSMPTATPVPTPAPTWAVLTTAGPWEAVFYSAYNQPGANSDGTGTAKLVKTRIWLDLSGPRPQKTLRWQRDTDGITGWTSGDRTMVLAGNVVNYSTPDVAAGTSYTALFTYGYRNASTGGYTTTDNSAATLSLSSVIAVQIRLITDISTPHTPKYIDLSTTVRPRNASGS